MAGILDLLNSDLGKTIISGVSGQTGQSTDKTGTLLTSLTLYRYFLSPTLYSKPLKLCPKKLSVLFKNVLWY